VGLFLKSLSLSAVTAMVAMMPARTGGDVGLQLDAGDAGRDVQPGLALHADRLQRVSIRGAADQEIAAAADADRCIGADATIGARKFTISEAVVRCIDGPGELGLRGDTEIEANPAHGGDIRFGPAAFALEYAFETGHRAYDEADILAALALQDAGANRRRRAGGRDRRHQRQRGDSQSQKSHESQSPHEKLNLRSGQEGSAVFKTWRFQKLPERSLQNTTRLTRDVI